MLQVGALTVPGYHEYMKPEEVADLLRLKVRTVYSWAQKNKIKHFYLGRSLRFERADVEEFIERQQAKVHPGREHRPPADEPGGAR